MAVVGAARPPRRVAEAISPDRQHVVHEQAWLGGAVERGRPRLVVAGVRLPECPQYGLRGSWGLIVGKDSPRPVALDDKASGEQCPLRWRSRSASMACDPLLSPMTLVGLAAKGQMILRDPGSSWCGRVREEPGRGNIGA